MSYVSQIGQAHETLRTRLAVLRSALRMQEEGHSLIYAVCQDIAAVLRRHMADETAWVVECSRAFGMFGSDTLARFAIEHHDERQCLKVILRSMRSSNGYSTPWLRAAVTTVISKLERHMLEQERALYPLLEGVWSAHTATPSTKRMAAGRASIVALQPAR